MAGKVYKAGMSLLVIDTENKFVSTGFAKEIARVAQGLIFLEDTFMFYHEFSILTNFLTNLYFRKILLFAKCFRRHYISYHKGSFISFKELLS